MARTPKPSGRKLPDKGKKVGRAPTRTRELHPYFLIVCEGEQTEPNYFKSFRVSADVKVIGTGRSTTGLVEYAKTLKDKAKRNQQAYTSVWVVFDRDDFSPENFNGAIEQAKHAGFCVAYSNEAFELWYVLHFDYMDNAISRQQYQDILSKRLVEPYRKNDLTLYARLLNRQPDAIRNAERLLASYKPHPNPTYDNPCTAVHHLVQELNRHIR
ncbi:MAG: RloB family protein [Chloroflexi bacterium]|nr:RloB family protein [Chloroflexota bacterium]